jgi:hypothetical protein
MPPETAQNLRPGAPTVGELPTWRLAAPIGSVDTAGAITVKSLSADRRPPS